MNPQGLAVRVLASLGAAMAFVLAGVSVGYRMATNGAEAKAGRQAKADQAVYQRQVEEGAERAESLREQLTQQGRYVATLQERTRHAAPLAVFRAPAAPVSSQACAGSGPADAGPALTTDEAAPQLAGGDGAVGISLAAVSLWNSALAGHDVSAAACRADDTASQACAADAGLDLTQLWANHQVNAASCAADRTRYQALIDHLNSQRP